SVRSRILRRVGKGARLGAVPTCGRAANTDREARAIVGTTSAFTRVSDALWRKSAALPTLRVLSCDRCFTQRAPDGLRRDRQADVAHPEMPERVDDRVADRGRRANRAALAAALDAERI